MVLANLILTSEKLSILGVIATRGWSADRSVPVQGLCRESGRQRAP